MKAELFDRDVKIGEIELSNGPEYPLLGGQYRSIELRIDGKYKGGLYIVQRFAGQQRTCHRDEERERRKVARESRTY